jgi:riboflavin kinase / FMN adenylyltransferase
MKIIEGHALGNPSGSPDPLAPLALAIGNFDGVHLGHRQLIAATRARAAARGIASAVLTFTPHPARVFAPALAPPLITTLPRRLELLEEAGLDVAIVQSFTREFAAIEAEDFVRDVLARRLGARDIVVGYDFSFGRGRRGNPALLASVGQQAGMDVTVVPQVMTGGLICSSTKIREFVLEGRVEGASLLLGRPFEIEGRVVRGAGRGRGLGVPTANIAAEGELLPRVGIYAARATILDGDGLPAGPFLTALSVGSNPTFVTGGGITVEAHLLDFDGDLYGRRLRLAVLHRLRDERRFDSVATLLAQIREDIAEVRARLS